MNIMKKVLFLLFTLKSFAFSNKDTKILETSNSIDEIITVLDNQTSYKQKDLYYLLSLYSRLPEKKNYILRLHLFFIGTKKLLTFLTIAS